MQVDRFAVILPLNDLVCYISKTENKGVYFSS